VDGIHTEDAFGPWLITDGDVIARNAEDVPHAHCGGAEQVPLDCDAIPIPTVDLQDSFIARTGEKRTAGNAAHVTVGASTIGGVNGVAALG
jgi:hypothetical protein